MAHALVQKTSQRAASGANAKAYASNVTAGSLLVVAIADEAVAATITSVVDNNSNTWTAIGTLKVFNNYVGQFYYAKNANAGATTVTVTPSTGASTIHIMEFSGLDTTAPFDSQAAATGTSTTPNSGNLTTAANNELLVGLCIANQAVTLGSGFTVGESTSFNYFEMKEFKNAPSAGTFSAAYTLGSSNEWLCCAAAFKEPSAGGSIAAVAMMHHGHRRKT